MNCGRKLHVTPSISVEITIVQVSVPAAACMDKCKNEMDKYINGLNDWLG